MADDKKTSNFDLLPEAKKREIAARAERGLEASKREGNEYAIKQPDLIRRNLREGMALGELLSRADGTVFQHGSTQYARVGNLEVSLTKGDSYTPINGVRIEQIPSHGTHFLNASEDGKVMTGHNYGAEGYNCAMSLLIRGAVADALKDGKLNLREASNLREMLSKTPNVSKHNKPCGPGKGV